MSKQAIATGLTLISLLILSFGTRPFSASAINPNDSLPVAAPQAVASQQPNCDEIIKNVLAKVRGAFTAAELQQFQAPNFRFGFNCRQGVITVRGNPPRGAKLNKLLNAIKQTPGVKGVRVRRGGGCGPNEIDCFGDGSVCATSQAACPVRCCEGN